jgi:hypothetical protein
MYRTDLANVLGMGLHPQKYLNASEVSDRPGQSRFQISVVKNRLVKPIRGAPESKNFCQLVCDQSAYFTLLVLLNRSPISAQAYASTLS